MKTVLVSLCLASVAQAAAFDKATFGGQAPTSCSEKAKDCSKEKKARKEVFESLKGSTETTRLPDTARYDARGGVFI